jgi:hypothetical protein
MFAEKHLRRLVGRRDRAARIGDDDGVGQGGHRRLERALRAQHLAHVRAPRGRHFFRHPVHTIGELTELVVGADGGALIEVAAAHRLGAGAERPQRPNDHARQVKHDPDREQQRHDRNDRHDHHRPPRLVARPARHLLHLDEVLVANLVGPRDRLPQEGIDVAVVPLETAGRVGVGDQMIGRFAVGVDLLVEHPHRRLLGRRLEQGREPGEARVDGLPCVGQNHAPQPRIGQVEEHGVVFVLETGGQIGDRRGGGFAVAERVTDERFETREGDHAVEPRHDGRRDQEPRDRDEARAQARSEEREELHFHASP